MRGDRLRVQTRTTCQRPSQTRTHSSGHSPGLTRTVSSRDSTPDRAPEWRCHHSSPSCSGSVSMRTTLSDGLVNAACLPALMAAGYDRSFTELRADTTARNRPSPCTAVPALPDVLEVGDGWARLAHECSIDLGGVGKGWLADRLCERFDNAAINLGGDIRTRGAGPQRRGWDVALCDGRVGDRVRRWDRDVRDFTPALAGRAPPHRPTHGRTGNHRDRCVLGDRGERAARRGARQGRVPDRALGRTWVGRSSWSRLPRDRAVSRRTGNLT